MLPKKEYLKSMSIKMSSSFGLLKNKEGKVLIVKPSYKENWMPVGGSVDLNEHPAVACKREFKEEVNLDVSVGELIQVSSRIVEEDGERFDLFTFLFLVECDDLSVLKVDGDEIIDYKWCELDEVSKYLRKSWTLRFENLKGCEVYFEMN